MKCPKCGYKRQTRDNSFVPPTECPSCGIVYAKHDVATTPNTSNSDSASTAPLQPSAVDPESLKKARDRVEKRLRSRMGNHEKDERDAKTLELARKLTGLNIRKRQLHACPSQHNTVDTSPTGTQTIDAEIADNLTEDPLLLEEVVGVRIHSEKSGKTEEISDDAPEQKQTSVEMVPDETLEQTQESVEKIPDESLAQSQAPSDMDSKDSIDDSFTIKQTFQTTLEKKSALTVAPSSDQASAHPNDVHIETVQLMPAILGISNAADEISVPDEKFIEQTAMESATTREQPRDGVRNESIPSAPSNLGRGLKRFLPIVAWIILFSGIIGAVLSWTTIGDVEAGIRVIDSYSQGTLPLGLLLGFAYLAIGALGFAFFWISSLINRQLKDIQQLLMNPPSLMSSNGALADLPDMAQYNDR